MSLPAHPLVYEINTRCWLRELSAARGAPVTLANVPDEVFVRWRVLEFTHIWLMGIWPGGPHSRAVYLNHPDTPGHLRGVLPDWTEADVAGSPYAIADYCVPGSLGGEAGLSVFRKKLHAAGLGLILDFIPNHLGLDHPWLALGQHPEYFVQSDHSTPDTFPVGATWFAHGKDPYFPAWSDTVQLDHRRADTRAAVLRQLHSVAARCDGVRCDMSMLLLTEVFASNWARFPCPGPGVFTEFWAEAIAAVRRPGFLFLAEAYWDLEARLQLLGFDFTYDKRVLDFLIERRPEALQRHLWSRGDAFVRQSAHFLENHDEPRIAPRLSIEEHQAAAWLTLSLPGLRLLHEGQLAGASVRVPVHLSRRPRVKEDPRISSLYSGLLSALQHTAVGRSDGRLLQAQAAAPGEDAPADVIAVEWSGQTVDIAVVNLSSEHRRCRFTPTSSDLAGRPWHARDRMLVLPYRPGETIEGPSLILELPPHAIRLLRCEPKTR